MVRESSGAVKSFVKEYAYFLAERCTIKAVALEAGYRNPAKPTLAKQLW